MPDCAACPLFKMESETGDCLHMNRPGGLELTATALDLCQLPTGSAILDIASGTGATLTFLRQHKFQPYGLDLSRQMLESHKSYDEIHRLVQADCLRLPFNNTSFTAVIMECALSLSRNLTDTLNQFQRVLKMGGKLIITDIYLREAGLSMEDKPLPTSSCLAGAVSEPVIRDQVTSQGFNILHWQDHTPLLRQWIARLIFKLGSLDAVYHLLAESEEAAHELASGFGSRYKLGYYLLIAEK